MGCFGMDCRLGLLDVKRPVAPTVCSLKHDKRAITMVCILKIVLNVQCTAMLTSQEHIAVTNQRLEIKVCMTKHKTTFHSALTGNS